MDVLNEQCGYQLTMKGLGDTDYTPLKTRRARAVPSRAMGGAGTGDEEEKAIDYGDVMGEGVASHKKEEPIPSVPMFRMAAPTKKV